MTMTKKQQSELVNFIKEKELDVEYTENADWSNFCKTVNLRGILLLKVYDKDSAKAILDKIEEMNAVLEPEDCITCRPAAGGRSHLKYSYSFSQPPLVVADIIMNCIFSPDNRAVQQIDAKRVKHIPAAQLGKIDGMMSQRFGLMPESANSIINRITEFGLTAVGGHGADVRGGISSDDIESLTILMQGGKEQTISRDEYPDEFEVLARAHLGLPGIVTEMVMKCKPAERLRCIRTPMSLPEFLRKVKSGELPRFNDPDPAKNFPIFNVYFVPFANNDLMNEDNLNLLVIEYQPVGDDVENCNYDVAAEEKKQDWEIYIEEGLRLTDIIALFPSLVTPYMKYVIAPLSIGTQPIESVGDGHALLHYQLAYPWEINDLDCLFPVSNDFSEMVTAFEKIAEEIQLAKEKGQAPVLYCVYFRLIKNMAYKYSLAPGSHYNPDGENKPYIGGLDVVSCPNAPGFEEFRDRIVNFLIEEFDAKLHWGKYVPLNKGIDYKKMYGESLVKFKKALLKLHVDNDLDISKSPFITEFFCELLDLYDLKPMKKTENNHSTYAYSPPLGYSFASRIKCLLKLVAWLDNQDDMHGEHKEHFRNCIRDVHNKELNALPLLSHFFVPNSFPEKQDPSAKAECVLF